MRLSGAVGGVEGDGGSNPRDHTLMGSLFSFLLGGMLRNMDLRVSEAVFGSKGPKIVQWVRSIERKPDCVDVVIFGDEGTMRFRDVEADSPQCVAEIRI